MEALIIVAALFILWTQHILMTPKEPPKKPTTTIDDLANALKKFLEASSEGQKKS